MGRENTISSKDILEPLEVGQTHVLRREDLVSSPAETSDSQEAAFMQYFAELAAVPQVDGLAFYRIKQQSGGPYVTTIMRELVVGDRASGTAVDAVLEAKAKFGRAMGLIIPGGIYRLKKEEGFDVAEKIIRDPRGSSSLLGKNSDLKLLCIVRFE